MSNEARKKTVATPTDPIEVNVSTVDPIPQEISPASADDIQVFDHNASLGQRFLGMYLAEASGDGLTDYDAAFRVWLSESPQRLSEEQVAAILGACLGNILVADLNMEWVVVRDEYGTDYAVRSKVREVTSFPFAAVAKRIESKGIDFMHGVFHAVKASIEQGDYQER